MRDQQSGRSNEWTIKALCDFYLVLVGLSLKAFVESLTDEKQNIVIDKIHLANILIFAATVVPFALGAIRHMYLTYLGNPLKAGQNPRKGAILLDAFLQLIQGALFIFWANLNANGDEQFLWGFIAVLGLDVVYSILAYFIFPSRDDEPELKWAGINFISATICFLFMYIIPKVISKGDPFDVLNTLVVCLAVLRTVADFRFNLDFYFGTDD